MKPREENHWRAADGFQKGHLRFTPSILGPVWREKEWEKDKIKKGTERERQEEWEKDMSEKKIEKVREDKEKDHEQSTEKCRGRKENERRKEGEKRTRVRNLLCGGLMSVRIIKLTFP